MFNLRRRLPIVFPLLAAFTAACGPAKDDIDERLAQLDKLVPASGIVKVGGKPMAGVVVAFVPDGWALAHGETDEDGRFTMETAARPGVVPGDYKVTISYLLAKNGKPLGLGPRSAFPVHPDLPSAVEKLPPSYASLDKTEVRVTIPLAGAPDLVFDVDAKIDPAQPEADAQPESDKPAEAPKAEPEKTAEPPKN